jgi:RNA polymerase sigma factor FliA
MPVSTSARDRLIADHVDIARRISLRMARRCPKWIGRDDLVAAGLLGLIEAAARYDHDREEPFLPFAEKRIRGAVLDELRRGDIMPRRVRQLARRISQIIADLERRDGCAPTDEQIAGALGVGVEHYRERLARLVHIKVDSLGAADEARLTAAETSPEAAASHAESIARVREALSQLEPRDTLVLSLYYNEDLTYAEIGHVLGVVTSRVCQLHARAIARLRAELVPNGARAAA